MKSTQILTEIQIWPIDRLIDYARNPRRNDSAVDRMCGSIREFGFKIPCLARSDGELIDGHLRLKAARKPGVTDIPVRRGSPGSAEGGGMRIPMKKAAENESVAGKKAVRPLGCRP